MKNTCLTLPALVSLLVSAGGGMPAPASDVQTCVVVLTGQNQKRTVAGSVNTECDDVSIIGPYHDPPWGNWGVSSNYGGITDTDQFRGWKHKDGPPTKKQWNSCTTDREKFRAPNCSYYNAPKGTTPCMTQRSYGIATHGQMSYRTTSEACIPVVPGSFPLPYTGCRDQGVRSVGQDSNYMTLYELDEPDSDDYVDRIFFPGTYVTLTGCDHDGCPEKTSGWVKKRSSNTANAELRMKASAYLEGSCGWGW